MENTKAHYPEYLSSYGHLQSYFNEHFSDLATNTHRGRTFNDFVIGLIPHTDIGGKYPIINSSEKESHDKGVDIIGSQTESKDILAVQSKYTVKGKDGFDSIISKFRNYQLDYGKSEGKLELFSENSPSIHFVIVTIASLSRIIKNYEDSRLSSKEFYTRLKNEGRITVIDGEKIFSLLRNVYRKLFVLPTKMRIKFTGPLIKKDNVHVGILDTKELNRIYQEFGDALFFENIREFLGVNRKQKVNQDIIKTLETDPAKFLSLNNGLTFRTTSLESVDDDEIILNGASIVNGCQTTMSIVNFYRAMDNDSIVSGNVLVKVVETDQSWDVAKSANFQNEINKIDLDLAQFISPQKVRLAADEAGYKMEGTINSPYALLDRIYSNKVTYESIRTLFTGFFSRNPINVLQIVHSEMKKKILDGFFKDSNKNKVYQILFLISEAADIETEKINKKLTDQGENELKALFQRLLKSDNARYQSLLTILACCGAFNENVYDRKIDMDYEGLVEFLQTIEGMLNDNQRREKFSKSYFAAFRVIANHIMQKHQESNKDKIAQSLYKDLQYANFNTLYTNMRLFLIE